MILFIYLESQKQDKVSFQKAIAKYRICQKLETISFKNEKDLQDWYPIIDLFIHSDWSTEPLSLVFSESTLTDTLFDAADYLWKSTLRNSNNNTCRDTIYFIEPQGSPLLDNERIYLQRSINDIFDSVDDLIVTVLQ